MRGKLILIEGTDCSGKQTQSELLVKRLKENGRKIEMMSFPMYDTPTGKIVRGPYLGKPEVCESWFPEGATNVDPKVASLYYAADRLYNVSKITNLLNKGIDVILDRYTASNMAHQGGKLADKQDRYSMYKWVYDLEQGYLELPVPDFSFLLYMPYQFAEELRASRNRVDKPDEHELSSEHLKNAETAYLEIADLYDFDIVDCILDGKIKSRETINDELYKLVMEKLEK
jgi:dTMP kinase